MPRPTKRQPINRNTSYEHWARQRLKNPLNHKTFKVTGYGQRGMSSDGTGGERMLTFVIYGQPARLVFDRHYQPDWRSKVANVLICNRIMARHTRQALK